MIRLRRDEWSQAEHLIDETLPFVNVTMAFQRRTGAQVWVDNAQNPSTLIIIADSDAWAWGDLSHPSVKQLLACFSGTIASGASLEPLLSHVWPDYIRIPTLLYRYQGTCLESPLAGCRHTISRGPCTLGPVGLVYDPSEFRFPSTLQGACDPPSVAPGFALEPIHPRNVHLVNSVWPDYIQAGTIGHFLNYADFFAHSYGYMVLDEAGHTCVAACAAISMSARRVDHGVDTLFAYEGRGLATWCAHATVQEGVRRGLDPVWLAAEGNAASHRVATKVGFVPERQLMLYERLVPS